MALARFLRPFFRHGGSLSASTSRTDCALSERILSWPHTGFNVHSLVRAKTKPEAERVGKYMLRPILALERLTLLEAEGKVGYRHGEKGAELETMDYLEFKVDPMLCPKCGGRMNVIVFLTDSAVVDRIIEHLKLAFVAERPPPYQAAFACANRFPALPAVLDTAREPVYALRRGRNKIPFRIRTRPKPRAEKEFLSPAHLCRQPGPSLYRRHLI